MKDDIQRRIFGALLVTLRPIARALLRVGIGYRDFSEIAKTAFVDTATKDYGLRGRPTNVSRVAIMTGLTRKEVSRIRHKSTAVDSSDITRSTPISQVLHRWHTDKEFLTSSGRPMPLSFDNGDVSFTTLVKRYGGDIPPGAMRTELKRISAIEFDDQGMLVALKRAPYSTDTREKLIGGLAKIIYPAALNLVHNMDDEDSNWWINVAVTSKYIHDSDRGRIMTVSSERLKELSESLDDMYGAYEALNVRNQDDDMPGKAVGVGLFYFEEDKSETDIFV
jgi:hypothetical protein